LAFDNYFTAGDCHGFCAHRFDGENGNPERVPWAFVLIVAPLLCAPIMTGIALVHFWNPVPLIYGGAAPTGWPLLDSAQDLIARFALPLFGYLARFVRWEFSFCKARLEAWNPR
jgi:hypothetical protein